VRIGLTICLLAAIGAFALSLRDGGVPGLIRGLDAVALLLALVTIVLA
jgi:hypothetical protein